MVCRMHCQHGWATDEQGCDICECKQPGEFKSRLAKEILVSPGPNFTALLTGKQTFALTIAERFS